jgi:hypothetical protein
MVLKIKEREHFLNSFLIPLSKVSDSVVIHVEQSQISSLVSTSDNTVIVSCEYKDDSITASKRLNIPDVKKFCRIIQCIETENLELTLDTNSINYSSPSVRFKYHLYDDSIISVPKLNLSKLDKLDFNGNFKLNHQTIVSLIKGSSIATDTSKIYISFKDNIVYGELTDRSRANVDSYGLKIADTYSGVQINDHIPLNFEIFRIISSMKFDTLNCKIASSTGVMVFDMQTSSTAMKFIVSALAN